MTARVTSAAATMSLTASHSAVVWISRMPVPRFTTSSPRRLRMLASQPPPIDAETLGRRRDEPHDGGVVGDHHRLVGRAHLHLDPRAGMARGGVLEAAPHVLRLR